MVREVLDTLRKPGQGVAEGDGSPSAGTSSVCIPGPAGPTGHSGVVIEIMYLRVDESGRWHYRCAAEQLPMRTDPERAARHLTGLDDADGSTTAVLHSTSWRYDPAGHVVLTYAVLPDPDPTAPVKSLPGLAIARGHHHTRPAPAAIGPENVAAHAIRHLAWLAGTDPVVAAALGEDGTIRRALADVCPDPAGQLSS